MNLIESIRVALQSILANKMRSFLTMLGMIIGVAAVIALVAAGAGTQAAVTSQFESLGSNLLVISSRQSFYMGRGMGVTTGGAGSAGTLDEDDVTAIRRLASYVATVAPEYSSDAQVVYGSNNTRVSVVGVTAEYAVVRDWGTDRGRFINALDESTHAKVVVLGSSVAEDLFGDTLVNPIGKTVKINRQNYQVVGILATKGTSGMDSLDNSVYIPLSTAQLRLGGAGTKSLTGINIQAVSAEMMDAAEAQLTSILRASHDRSKSPKPCPRA